MAKLTTAGPVNYVPMPPFRWYDLDNKRHGIRRTLADGAFGETLCGETVIPQAGQKMTSRLTCPVCDDLWRVALGHRTRAEIKAAIEKAARVPGPRGGK